MIKVSFGILNYRRRLVVSGLAKIDKETSVV